jgi:hypothetical protein
MYDWQSQSCINQAVSPNPQNRGVVAMRVDVMAGQSCGSPPCNVPPVMWPVNGSNQITNQYQDVDSRVTGSVYGNSVPAWGPTQEGSTTLQFKNVIGVTNCSMTPAEKIQTFAVHVMACKPEWFTDASPGAPGTINYHGPASGTIIIRIPSAAFEDARGPAAAAAADWATALGRTINVEPGYGTCTVNDPLCIGFLNDHGTRIGDLPGTCASFDTASYNPSTGVWTGTTNVRFENQWTGGHADNLRETIAHELGHYFGLWNRSGSVLSLVEK